MEKRDAVLQRVLFVPWSVKLQEEGRPRDGRQGAYARQVPRYLSLRLEEVAGVDAQFAPYCTVDEEETVFVLPGARQEREELVEIGSRYGVDLVISGLSEFGEDARVLLQIVHVSSGKEIERGIVATLDGDCRPLFESLLGIVLEEILPVPPEQELACSELSARWEALSPFFCAIDKLMAMEIDGTSEDPAAPFALFFEALAIDPSWEDGADQLIGAALDYGLEGRGPIDLGIDALQQLILQGAEQHKAWGALGYLHYQLEQYDDAIACLERCKELGPGEFASHHRLGAAYRLLKRHDEAELVMKEGLLDDPDNIPLLIELGAVLGENGRSLEAAAHFQHAVELSPISGAFYGNLAVALKRAGERQRAEEAFRAGLQALDPHWNVYANYAQHLQEEGRHLEWAGVLFQGLQALAEEGEERHDLARRLVEGVREWMQTEPPADVQAKGSGWLIGLFESLVEELPEQQSAWVVLAELYRAEQRVDRALQCLHRVEGEDPYNVWLKIHIGSVLVGEERYEEARDRFRQVLDLEEENGVALFNLMMLATLQNRYDEAIGYLDRYRVLVPGDPQITSWQELIDSAAQSD
jgi:tetratricopeptide (TPR) repeat protein